MVYAHLIFRNSLVYVYVIFVNSLVYSYIISLSHPQLLSLSLRLSFSLSLSLSLDGTHSLLARSTMAALKQQHALVQQEQKWSKWWGMASQLPNHHSWRRWVARGKVVTLPVLCRSPASFGGQHGCKSIPLNLLFLMVPSICDENALIDCTYFHAK